MIVIHGSRLYGKVDRVPGLFHVATRFFHIYYIPLIPLGSTVVVAETKEGWKGIKVGLSLKSILITWGRIIGWWMACTSVNSWRRFKPNWIISAIRSNFSDGVILRYASTCLSRTS